MVRFLIILLLIFICIEPLAATRDPFQDVSQSESNSANSVPGILIPIHYADAEDIAKSLIAKNSGFLSTSGHISVDKRTNSIWVQDDGSNLNRIRKFIKSIDIPVKQIQIEARIVNIDEDFTKELGLEFGTVSGDSNNKSSGGLTMDLPTMDNNDNKINPGHFTFTLARLSNNILLDTELSAIESEGHGKIISRPKLITLNRKPAYIDSGEDIPYQERTGQGNTNVTFKKAVLGLRVTPSVVSNNKILLDITVNQDKVSSLTVQGVPAIATREIKTQVVVNNKETVVLGGIYEQAQDNVVRKIPILSAIPLFGKLFTHKQTETERKELLIFITPQIVF
jgi:type IV pilus assembly protein PilQ